MTSIVSNSDDTEKALASLAVLNVNWHTHAKSYLDSFVPFVVEAIRRSGKAEVTDAEAAEMVRGTFGISIPVEVVGSILKRAVRQSLGSKVDGGKFLLTSRVASVGTPSLEADLARLLREQADLESALVSYALDRFNLVWKASEASKALLAYIEDASARMVVASYQGATPQDDFSSTEPQRLVVSAFIKTIWLTDPSRFDYLMNVAKGSFLATTLFFQNHFDQTRRFRRTTLYLDTGVILAALGHEGPEREGAATEWIALARAQGAEVAVFDRTVREARGVLQNALDSIKSGRGWQGRPGTVTAWFHENSYSPGVIAAQISATETRLSRLHIDIRSMPEPSKYQSLQLDETEVESVLNEGDYPYVRENALRHDSRVLNATRMARGRHAQDRFEESRAVFVTGNYRVVRAARKVEDLRNEPWPVAMHVNDVAVLLWIKDSGQTPDLPRKQLLTVCLSILRPSEATWTRYVDEMNALQAQGSIEDVDIALIAQQNEQDAAAIVDEIRPGGSYKYRKPLELLARARAKAAEPARAAANEATAALLASRRNEAELASKLAAIKGKRLANLEKWATVLAGLLLAACIGLVSLGVFVLVKKATQWEGVVTLAGLAIQVLLAVFPLPDGSLALKLKGAILKRLVGEEE